MKSCQYSRTFITRKRSCRLSERLTNSADRPWPTIKLQPTDRDEPKPATRTGPNSSKRLKIGARSAKRPQGCACQRWVSGEAFVAFRLQDLVTLHRLVHRNMLLTMLSRTISRGSDFRFCAAIWSSLESSVLHAQHVPSPSSFNAACMPAILPSGTDAHLHCIPGVCNSF